jgi:pSer/pThr/pTyr-binding forkhead associated (FHA) protein
MGSNQFQIDITKPEVISLVIIEGPNVSQVFSIPKESKSTMGRKNNNDIHFTDDQHLSNMHATIYPVQGIWYVEDLGTTNGYFCFDP